MALGYALKCKFAKRGTHIINVIRVHYIGLYYVVLPYYFLLSNVVKSYAPFEEIGGSGGGGIGVIYLKSGRIDPLHQCVS